MSKYFVLPKVTQNVLVDTKTSSELICSVPTVLDNFRITNEIELRNFPPLNWYSAPCVWEASLALSKDVQPHLFCK